jgi:hypothetical protein
LLRERKQKNAGMEEVVHRKISFVNGAGCVSGNSQRQWAAARRATGAAANSPVPPAAAVPEVWAVQSRYQLAMLRFKYIAVRMSPPLSLGLGGWACQAGAFSIEACAQWADPCCLQACRLLPGGRIVPGDAQNPISGLGR